MAAQDPIDGALRDLLQVTRRFSAAQVAAMEAWYRTAGDGRSLVRFLTDHGVLRARSESTLQAVSKGYLKLAGLDALLAPGYLNALPAEVRELEDAEGFHVAVTQELGSPQPAADGEPSATTPLRAGERLGGHLLLSLLGSGGSSRVYRAVAQDEAGEVAVKVYEPGVLQSRDHVASIAREVQLHASLEHPSIVRLLGAGVDDGRHFIVMECVDGLSLLDLLRACRRLEPEAAGGIVRSIALALAYARCQGVLHRDIKPGNVMLDRAGRVRLLDFGLGEFLGKDHRLKFRRPGLGLMSVGTPAYIAPEVVLDPTTGDSSADIYSLGVTAYQVLTGRLPFYDPDPRRLARMHVTEPIVPPDALRPDVPRNWSELIVRMLSKQPERRPQEYDEIVAAFALGAPPDPAPTLPDASAEPAAPATAPQSAAPPTAGAARRATESQNTRDILDAMRRDLQATFRNNRDAT